MNKNTQPITADLEHLKRYLGNTYPTRTGNWVRYCPFEFWTGTHWQVDVVAREAAKQLLTAPAASEPNAANLTQ
jgi:hypothetical protein